jgi:hypothetical protein
MAKRQPPDTVSRTLFLPNELHKRIASVARYGETDDLIIECLTEAMKPRWEEWLKRQAKELGYDLKK